MLVSLSTLRGSKIEATDGDVGNVEDIYFDDRFWAIRFLVADMQRWVPLSKKLLVSPIALSNFAPEQKVLKLAFSKSMVEKCPKADEHQPVSRKFERMFFDYFGFGYYWSGGGVWGNFEYPTALISRDNAKQNAMLSADEVAETNLRSAKEVLGYSIHATDGKKGHVEDLIWDTRHWTLKFAVLDTRDWLPGGKKVLVTAAQLGELHWKGQSVEAHFSAEQIEQWPEYVASKINDTEYLNSVEKALNDLEAA